MNSQRPSAFLAQTAPFDRAVKRLKRTKSWNHRYQHSIPENSCTNETEKPLPDFGKEIAISVFTR